MLEVQVEVLLCPWVRKFKYSAAIGRVKGASTSTTLAMGSWGLGQASSKLGSKVVGDGFSQFALTHFDFYKRHLLTKICKVTHLD